MFLNYLGLEMIEGDIIPHEEPTDDLLVPDESREKKAVYTNDNERLWPDGIIPFRIGTMIGRQIFIIHPIFINRLV